MQTEYEIFISSKMVELKAEREMLQELIPSLSQGMVKLKPWIYEGDAEASNKSIRDVYLKALQGSALYIGLFAELYGEWTIDEFHHASRWGIDRHIYVKKVDKRDEKLDAFLKEIADVETGIAPVWYSDVDDLREAVERSIKYWLDEKTIRRAGSLSATFARTPDDLLERPKKLIGRDDLLQQINASLDGGHGVLLQGFGGMGKTALAAEAAARRLSANQGAVLWQKMGSDSTEAVFEAMARPFNAQLEIAKLTGDDQIIGMRQLLTGRGVKLVVLDDVWNQDTLFQVMKSIPSGVGLVVTSRHRYPTLKRIDVGKLARDASLELLGYHAGEDYQGDTNADALCDKLGDSAYGVRVAGMTMNQEGLPPETMLQQLEQTNYKLNVPMGFAEDGQRSLADLLEVSLNMLEQSGQEGKLAKAVFLAMGAFFAPQMTPEMLNLYMEQDKAEIDSGLTMLTERGLADHLPASDNSVAAYRVHDLGYSYSCFQNADYQKGNALDACLTYTERYNEPSLTNFAALRPELDNMVNAAQWAMAVGQLIKIEQLTANLFGQGSEILDYLSLYTQAINMLELAVQAAKQRGNRRAQMVHLGNLGLCYINLGRFQDGIRAMRVVLEIAYELGDLQAGASAIGNLGNAFSYLEQYKEAIYCYEQALAITREIKDRRNEGNQLGNLGAVYYRLEQYEQAITCHEQALAITREIKDRRNEGNQLGNLGIVYGRLGQYKQSINYLQQDLNICNEIGDQIGLGNALNNIGVVHEMYENYPLALDFYKQAWTIYNMVGVQYRVEHSERVIARVQGKLPKSRFRQWFGKR